MEYKTTSEKETEELGKTFAGERHSRDVVCLYGDLGLGKTTFARGFAKGLGITKRIISPTFPIIRVYRLKNENSFEIQDFYHIDLYRIEGENAVSGLDMDDFLGAVGTVSAVEWPEKIREKLPKKRWDIFFDYISENERKITILKRE